LKKRPRYLKRKDFMKIFSGSDAEYDCNWRVSNRRADSDPCVDIAKAAAVFADAKPIPLAYNSLRQPLRAKYGMLSLGSFAAPKAFTSARIESQRRTRRPAAACTLATLSQRRSGCNS
jgi:hypothetical protein